jgi:hypothetical protein
MARALEGVPLPQGTSAVDGGRLVDAATGQPLVWEPVATVLPVSEQLLARVSGPEYEAAVAAESARFAYRLLERRAASARA